MNTWAIFITAVITVILGELPCVVRTVGITFKEGRPWVVFAGTMVGTALVMGLTAFFSAQIREQIPHHVVKYIACAVFLGMAAWSLME